MYDIKQNNLVLDITNTQNKIAELKVQNTKLKNTFDRYEDLKILEKIDAYMGMNNIVLMSSKFFNTPVANLHHRNLFISNG